MSGTLCIRNRQRTRRVNTGYLRRLARGLLCDLLRQEGFNLGVCVVDAADMTRLNETFLRHRGSTDVIAFKYSEPAAPLHGEVFLCVDEAVSQARRFRTTWQSELVRYLIHGVLHLSGFDDTTAGKRRVMKRLENRLLKAISRRFPPDELGKLLNR